jgi:hypothetical protein
MGKADLYIGIEVHFTDCFFRLSGKCIIFIFCSVPVFVTHLMLSCNCHFISLYHFFSVPSETRNRGFLHSIDMFVNLVSECCNKVLHFVSVLILSPTSEEYKSVSQLSSASGFKNPLVLDHQNYGK